MESIFFNNDPYSQQQQKHQQQQQQQHHDDMTQKLLDDGAMNQTTNTNSNGHNTNLEYQQQSQFSPLQPQQQQQQVVFDDYHHHPTTTTSRSTDGHNLLPEQSPFIAGGAAGSKPPQQQQLEGDGKKYRDSWAAIVFLVLQCIVFYMAIIRGFSNIWYADNHDHTKRYTNDSNANHYDDTVPLLGIFYMVLLSTLCAAVATCTMLVLLMKYSYMFLQISIGLVVIGNGMVVLFCFLYSKWYLLLGAIVFLVFSIMCAQSYQRRIPFAAANLNVALAAITTNHGLLYIAFGISMVLNFIYCNICIFAYVGSYSKRQIDTYDDDEANPPRNMLALLFVVGMYYWTAEVSRNVIHVTTSGVMGTFWFVPDDASTFWSPAIYDSFYRSITYSFGSICFGSLVTTALQMLHQWIRYAKDVNRRTSLGAPSFILCILECISNALERIVTYFNNWAYVYIGLYGYDYLTAGNKVITLFMERGWTTIMNDYLVSNVLSLVSVMIGIGSGCVGILLYKAHPAWLDGFDSWAAPISFFVPMWIGMTMATTLTSVIMAAVDTVVVAFAEAPMEFERNHPGLSLQLVTAWRHVYPDEFGR